MATPHTRNTSGTSISQRLGYYLAGVAIGLLLLGFFMSQRQRAVQSGQAETREPASGEGVHAEVPVSPAPDDGP